MSLTFAPRVLFNIGSLSSRGDAHLADALHVSIRAHEALGLPLHPFVAMPLPPSEPMRPVVYSTLGVAITLPIQVQGTVIVHFSDPTTPGDPRLTRVLVQVAAGSRLRVRLVERGRPEVVLAQRTIGDPSKDSTCGFSLAGSADLEFDGKGVVKELSASRLQASLASVFDPAKAAAFTFGLPVSGDHRWYVAGEGIAPGYARVQAGAPKTLWPIDRPDGSVVAASAQDEEGRVKSIANPLFEALTAAIDDPSVDPRARLWKARGSVASGNDQAAFEMSAHAALQTFAADPGLARLLGFALPVTTPANPNGWAVAALYAIDPRGDLGNGTLMRDLMLPQSADEIALRDALISRYPAVKTIAQQLTPLERVLVPVVGTVTPGFELDAPEPPQLQTIATAWQVMTDTTKPGRPAATCWRHSLKVQGSTRPGMLALARSDGAVMNPLNMPIPSMPSRRVAAFAARTKAQGGTSFPAFTDVGVPESVATATWKVFAADDFGRWSPPATLTAAAPARPGPPPPQPRVWLERATSDPGPQGVHSPGAMRATVQVPRVQSLPPGSLAIKEVLFTVGGITKNVQVAPPANPQDAGTIVEFSAAAPTLLVGEIKSAAWDVRFRTGSSESVASGVLEMRDGRRPPPLLSSRLLLWTARRDAAGHAEIALRWNAPAPAYNVYLSSERTLVKPLGIQDAGFLEQARARRATRICEALATRGASASPPDDRALFTLLTDAPITAANGAGEFRFPLPGTSETVHFLRIVPVSATGVEGTFARCDVVPVAVPLDVVLPAPTLVVRPSQGRVTVQVTVGGINSKLLTSLQQTAGTTAAIECRVRRTFASTRDALYFPEIKRLPMTPDANDPSVWTASFDDGGAGASALPPFVPITYAAQVRLPPELASIRDAQVVIVANGVEPIGAVAGAAMEGVWSTPSIPAAITLIPATVPEKPQALTLQTAANGTRHLTVSALPKQHPRAMAPYQLVAWIERTNGSISKPEAATVSMSSPFTHELNDAGDCRAVHAALIDPVGRVGAIARVELSP